ncbi:GntR family transcriptional regulator (plasmid) [Agrobacterium rosae]|uniref:GntR family transcriptional regulator n=1 Tax=Agrobacterium rosae TaxID=1972867 RepID=UPI002A0F0916|nr:GntR family transcriptional regulator [Agrobacterium rosae]MDX8316807.1 GntR family transcriptional regulator [Agrobacterium rosae]
MKVVHGALSYDTLTGSCSAAFKQSRAKFPSLLAIPDGHFAEQFNQGAGLIFHNWFVRCHFSSCEILTFRYRHCMLDQSSPFAHPALQPEGKNAFAFKRLKRALIECELAPADAVSEGDISERFGLGRAAVRNALARLEVEGFISPIPRNGWQVAPITGAAIGDILEARNVVESQLGKGVLLPEESASFRIIASQLDALAGRSEAEAILAARALDRSFLNLLARRRGEIVVQWLNGALDHSARLLSYFEGKHPSYVSPSRTALVDVLENGDEAAAKYLLLEDVQRFREYIVDHMLRSKTFTSALPQPALASRMSEQPSIDPSAASHILLGASNSENKGNEQ